jgi:hypothetical protein
MTKQEEIDILNSLKVDDVIGLLVKIVIPDAKFKIKPGAGTNYSRLEMKNKPSKKQLVDEFAGWKASRLEEINAEWAEHELREDIKERLNQLVNIWFIIDAAGLDVSNPEAFAKHIIKDLDVAKLEELEANQAAGTALYEAQIAKEGAKGQRDSNAKNFLRDLDIDNMTPQQEGDLLKILALYLRDRVL